MLSYNMINVNTLFSYFVTIITKSKKENQMKYSTLVFKLEKKIDYKPSQSELARIISIKPNAMSGRASRDSDFSEDEIKKIQSFYGVALGENNNNCVELDYYPNVFGSCGGGTMVFDESKEKITVAKDMIINYSPSKVYGVMSAVGCSMSPKIEDGDKLVIEKWNGEQIKDNRVYLFRYNDELFIKRLVKNIDQIVCISENPRFEDRIIKDLKNFNLVGEIVGLFRERV
nr:MAG TPA: Repressor protein CI [Caudoviricetes sp.]